MITRSEQMKDKGWTNEEQEMNEWEQGKILDYSVSINNPPILYRGRILWRNWDKSLNSFPYCYSQSPPLTNSTNLRAPPPSPAPPPPSKKGLEMVCNVNIAYGNLKSENSDDYAQKPQRSCTFMNSASVHAPSYTSHGKRNKNQTVQYILERSIGYVVFVLLILGSDKFVERNY
jgi:hypothetical protein